MAQSRLEKIGTIYSRVTGLYKSGAIKQEQLPLWYPIYEVSYIANIFSFMKYFVGLPS